MAGQIEQGFGEEHTPEDGPLVETVHIETDAFKADAINLYEMPGLQVLEVFSTPGLQQMPKMVTLFRLSLNDTNKADDIAVLSFSELAEAVSQWVMKSQEESAGQVEFGLFE
jgi:hypothetical protein